MTCNNHNASRKHSVVSLLRAIPLILSALFAAPSALALDSGDIFVVSARGEVQLTAKGATRDVRVGSVLELPATLRTGRDGSVELKQGATTVSVGPDTVLDFPALERRGAPIDRIQQLRGNAFYNIGKRDGRKLRVETPYLVGVVKGTQFNVASRDEATTISLFEGLLEVRAIDDSAVVDLKAGEVASRRRGDRSIDVIRMDSGKLPTTAPRPASDGGSSSDSPRAAGQDELLAGNDAIDGNDNGAGLIATVNPGRPDAVIGVEARALPVGVDVDAGVSLSGSNGSVSVAADAAVGNPVDTGIEISVSAGSDGIGADLATSTGVSAGPVSVDVDAAANVGVSGVTADLGVGPAVSVGPAAVDLSTSVTVDAGPASIAVDTGAVVDVGAAGAAVDLSASTAVDAGPIVADVSTGAAVDLGAGAVGADLTTATLVDAGPVTTALDAGAAVDIGTGGNVAIDTGASLEVVNTPVDVSAGVTAGVDLSSGSVDLEVSAGGLDVGLGVDLGLGADEPATDTGSSNTPATDTGNTGIVDVGGLLDGLLRRPGRR